MLRNGEICGNEPSAARPSPARTRKRSHSTVQYHSPIPRPYACRECTGACARFANWVVSQRKDSIGDPLSPDTLQTTVETGYMKKRTILMQHGEAWMDVLC